MTLTDRDHETLFGRATLDLELDAAGHRTPDQRAMRGTGAGHARRLRHAGDATWRAIDQPRARLRDAAFEPHVQGPSGVQRRHHAILGLLRPEPRSDGPRFRHHDALVLEHLD